MLIFSVKYLSVGSTSLIFFVVVEVLVFCSIIFYNSVRNKIIPQRSLHFGIFFSLKDAFLTYHLLFGYFWTL